MLIYDDNSIEIFKQSLIDNFLFEPMDAESLLAIKVHTIVFWELWSDSVAVLPDFSNNSVHVVFIMDGKLRTFAIAYKGAEFKELEL